MAVRKLKRLWGGGFYFDSKRDRKRSPHKTRQRGLAYELLLRQRLARDEPLRNGKLPSKDQTLAVFAATWFEDYVRPNNKYSERMAKQYALAKHLVPFFGQKLVGAIKAHDIEHYKAQQV